MPNLKRRFETVSGGMNRMAKTANTDLESRVRELVALFEVSRPDLTKTAVNRIINTSIAYAKDILKGKSAELYGMSLDYAIETLRDPDVPRKEKLLVVTKVLGHMLPTEVTLTGGEEGKPILFQMSRPVEQEPVVEKLANHVVDLIPKEV